MAHFGPFLGPFLSHSGHLLGQIPKPRNLNLAGPQNRGSQIWPKMTTFGPYLGPLLGGPFQANMRFSHVFGPKWPKMGQKGVPDMAQNGLFDLYRALYRDIGPNRPFWPKMAQNGPKWPKMAQNGLFWPYLAI